MILAATVQMVDKIFLGVGRMALMHCANTDISVCLSKSKAATFTDLPENWQVNLPAVEAAFHSLLMLREAACRQRHHGKRSRTTSVLVWFSCCWGFFSLSFTSGSSSSFGCVQRFRKKIKDNHDDSHPE